MKNKQSFSTVLNISIALKDMILFCGWNVNKIKFEQHQWLIILWIPESLPFDIKFCFIFNLHS